MIPTPPLPLADTVRAATELLVNSLQRAVFVPPPTLLCSSRCYAHNQKKEKKKKRKHQVFCHLQGAQWSCRVGNAWPTVPAFTPDCRSWRLDVKARSGAAAGRGGFSLSERAQSRTECPASARLASIIPSAPRWRCDGSDDGTGAIQFDPARRLHLHDARAMPASILR